MLGNRERDDATFFLVTLASITGCCGNLYDGHRFLYLSFPNLLATFRGPDFSSVSQGIICFFTGGFINGFDSMLIKVFDC
jgi:hypothetical protein